MPAQSLIATKISFIKEMILGFSGAAFPVLEESRASDFYVR
jgi:hypothetical protein